MEYSKTIDDVGSAGFSKVIHLFSLILRTWKIWFLERPEVMYYPPASAHKVPVIRDILYLGSTRFLFKKTVFHFHAGGLGQFLDSMGILGKLAKWIYRKPDLAIELYREPDSPGEYLLAKEIAIVPNGLDVEPDWKAGSSQDEFVILFVGAHREDKGVLDVLRTVGGLKAKGHAVKVLLAGAWIHDEFRTEALDLSEQLQISESVEWLGVVQGDDKWAAFRKASCFFFPTFYQSEKFPLVLIEALGMGLPVVTSEWRGIPQLVEGSGASILKPVGDVLGFAEALERLIGDKDLRNKMANSARTFYEKNYTLGCFLETMENELNSVVSPK
jgi:glycosyltransferase involved in cell wall biosynthesis